MKLLVKPLTGTAIPPRRAEAGSAGYDLHVDLGGGGSLVIPPGGRAVAESNVAVVPPEGCYVRVAGRSGLAAKQGVDVLAGVVDPSYRGGVGAVLVNTQRASWLDRLLGIDRSVRFRHGDRVAQLVVERHETPDVEVAPSLPGSGRGADGFGSTGLRTATGAAGL